MEKVGDVGAGRTGGKDGKRNGSSGVKEKGRGAEKG